MKLVGTCIFTEKYDKLTKGKEYTVQKIFKGDKLNYCGIVMVINDDGMLHKYIGEKFIFKNV